MPYPTGLTRLTARNIRVGGVPDSTKGAQQVFPGRVPSNWYPVNLPSASNGTPTNADCRTLLNTLAPLVADLTVQQSVFLALSYRTVQTGVSPSAAQVAFTVNNVNSATTGGVQGKSLFDRNVNLSESVAVDVVNKNPALGYDLAVRLAQQLAFQIDKNYLVSLYGQFTNSAVTASAGDGSITEANLATAIGELTLTGEPLFLVVQGNPADTVMSLASIAGTFLSDNPAMSGNGFCFVQTAAGTTPVRIIGSTAIVQTSGSTTTQHNILITPSALAFATADLGTVTGYNPSISPSGYVQYATSISKDPETGTPQLAIQLVVGNTGSGNQSVYANFLGAGIVINPGRGVDVQS